jgi:hypothetical protein
VSVIFTNIPGTAENRGRVQVLDKPGTGLTPGSILTVPGWGGFSQFKAIFQNITIAETGNYQFLHTLGNHIYIYVFGDRIGSFGLSGLAFYDNCVTIQPTGRIGIAHALNYYRANRIVERAAPLLITLDPDTVFRCFLLSFRGMVQNPATRIFQFRMDFAMVPEDALVGSQGSVNTISPGATVGTQGNTVGSPPNLAINFGNPTSPPTNFGNLV